MKDKSPPESGGAEHFSEGAPGWFQSGKPERRRFWNHPSRDPLRDPAALLTQEGNTLTSKYPGLHSTKCALLHLRRINTASSGQHECEKAHNRDVRKHRKTK